MTIVMMTVTNVYHNMFFKSCAIFNHGILFVFKAKQIE